MSNKRVWSTRKCDIELALRILRVEMISIALWKDLQGTSLRISDVQIITSSLESVDKITILSRTVVKIFQCFTNDLIAPFIILSGNKTKCALQRSTGRGPMLQN